MAKWCVEFDGSVEIEADSEEEAIELALQRVSDDATDVLMVNAERADEDDEDDDDDEEIEDNDND